MNYKTLIEETLCEIENIFNEEHSIPSEITNKDSSNWKGENLLGKIITEYINSLTKTK